MQEPINILPFDVEKVPEASLDPLHEVKWEEGSSVVYAADPGYRHGLVALMSEHGNWKATFADGKEHNFFRLTTIVGRDGHSRILGGHAIPRFPNGDLLMIVVQRPTIIPFGRRSSRLRLDGGTEFELGPMGSLEFAGGSIEGHDRSVSIGTIRELIEESGAELGGKRIQAAQDRDPIIQQIADTIVGVHNLALELPEGVYYPQFVENDGGIHTVRLSQKALMENHDRGVIVAGSTLHAIHFLNGVQDTGRYGAMLRAGKLLTMSIDVHPSLGK